METSIHRLKKQRLLTLQKKQGRLKFYKTMDKTQETGKMYFHHFISQKQQANQ